MELKIDNAAIEAMVKEHLKVEVAKVLGSKSDYLIRALVSSAIEQKQNSYDRHSILDSKVAELIREESTAALKEWLDSKRSQIRKQVWDACSKKSDGLVAKIVEKLVVKLGSDLDVGVWIRAGDRD